MRLGTNQLQIKITLEREGELCMGTALGISKKQLLALVLIILFLLVTATIVLHATAPNPLHAVAIIIWHP
jgi:hypothetical protein